MNLKHHLSSQYIFGEQIRVLVQYTRLIEEAISKGTLSSLANSLSLEIQSSHQLRGDSELSHHRNYLKLLCLLMLRDTIEGLKVRRVIDLFDFEWRKNIRYAIGSTGHPEIRTINLTLPFGSEYPGVANAAMVLVASDKHALHLIISSW